MSATGIPAFESTLQKTHIWLNDVMEVLGWEERHKAYVALRVTLHALRDRLIVDEAVHLGAQLPMLMRGFYYEGWRPSAAPVKAHKAELLAQVADAFRTDPHVDPETIVRAIFTVLAKYIAAGEIADVKALLPTDLAALWPRTRERGDRI
ncbi:MAG: DUF2267 domain-containing protein [Candidatus Binatia bacterium]